MRKDHSKDPLFVGPVHENKSISGRVTGHRFSIVSRTTLGPIDFDYPTRQEAIKSREAILKGDNAQRVPTLKLMGAIITSIAPQPVQTPSTAISSPPSTPPQALSLDVREDME